MSLLNEQLQRHLASHAAALDSDAGQADAVLPLLAAHGLLAAGVPQRLGGSGGGGGTASAAAAVVAALAEYSLSAAFVFWAQRAFIECLLASPNQALLARLLPALLDGSLAGAPGLSNGMKSLGGLERVQVVLTRDAQSAQLTGAVPWATNLQRIGFVAAVAAADSGKDSMSVFAISHDVPGVTREADKELAGLRATHTASLQLAGARIGDDWLIHPDARVFLPQLRPAFIGLQCGLGIGLARASLSAARKAPGGAVAVLADEIDALQRDVDACWVQLAGGLDEGRLRTRPAELVSLRIRMAELAATAARLELQALGGRAFVAGEDGGWARRAREAAFLAILTPTLAQLKTELARLQPPPG